MAGLLKRISDLQTELGELKLEKMRIEEDALSMSRKLDKLAGGLTEAQKGMFANQIRSEARAQFMKELPALKKVRVCVCVCVSPCLLIHFAFAYSILTSLSLSL